MTIEIGLEVCDVFNPGESSHGDLLPLFLVRQWLRHLVDCVVLGPVHRRYWTTWCPLRVFAMRVPVVCRWSGSSAHNPPLSLSLSPDIYTRPLYTSTGRVRIHLEQLCSVIIAATKLSKQQNPEVRVNCLERFECTIITYLMIMKTCRF